MAGLRDLLRHAVASGTSKSEIARAANVSRQMVDQWMAGPHRPGLDKIPGIARALGKDELTIALARLEDRMRNEEARREEEQRGIDAEADQVQQRYALPPDPHKSRPTRRASRRRANGSS